MEKPDAATIAELLRSLSETAPGVAHAGLQIVINGPILIGSDIGTVTALKLILKALARAKEPPALTKAKIV